MRKNATCPVMNVAVNKQATAKAGLTRSYQGQTYYLYCKTCEQLFDKDPAKYKE